MKRLDEITIADLMPDSISGDAEVSATAQAIDPQLKAISEAVDKPLILAAIDDLSEGVLEHLAVQYDVTAWNSAWPIETKQAVLKTAIADKRKMGTRGAVQRAIEAVAPIATITEWWQDTGGDMPPHTFEIDLLQEGSAVDAETQASVIAQVNEAKPVRSHFTFSVGQMLDGNVYFAGVLRSIAYARVRSAGISIEQMGIEAGILAAMRGMNIRRLLTSSHMGEMPEPTPPETHPSYIVVDSTTGIIIHSIEDEGLVYGDVGYVLMDEAAQMITVYETGVRTESFYFTELGRNETQNTNISHADIPVYLEDGTAPSADTPYDSSSVLALMDVTGNTKQADGESLYVDNGVLRLDAPDTDEGEQWAALAEYIEPAPPAPSELTAYFTNQGSAATGDSNPSYGSYTMYDASGQTVSTQSGETYALVAKFNKAGTRVPIYPLAPYGGDYLRQFYGTLLFETVTAQNVFRVIYNIGLYAYFTTTGATESANTSISNSSYYLYDSNGNQISYDSSKTYTIKAIYDIDGNRVLNVGNSYFTSYLGKLKFHGDSETFLTYDAYIIVYEKS